MANKKSHKNRNLEDHVSESVKVLETNVLDAPVTDIPWEAQQLEVHSDPLEDAGTGRTIVIRRFSFQLPPNLPYRPSKAAILEQHRTRIITFLWKDELELIMEPKVVMGKNGKFDIFATCKAKKGSLILQEPMLINHVNTAGNTN